MPSDEEWKKRSHIDGRRPDVRNRPVDETVEREIENGIQMLTEDLISEGWDPDQARREAERRFGDTDRLRRRSKRTLASGDRRKRIAMFFDALAQDTRFALRSLRKAPGFTLIAVLIIAVGVGANVAIFSMLKGLVLRPLPYPDADRIVAVWETELGERGYQPLTGPDYFDYREQNRTFQDLGVYTFTWFNLMEGEGPERIRGILATASVLDVLNMPPYRGRYFTEEEEQQGRDHVAVLTHGFWRDRFDGDPTILGTGITMDRRRYEVIGILPPDFETPSPWGLAEQVEVISPVVLSRTEGRGSHSLAGIGRLKDGVTVRQAESDLKTIASRLREAYPTTNALVDIWLDDLMHRALGGISAVLIALLLIVAFVLLIGCANIASMMLARGAGRQTEMAVRASMGAGSGRILWQLLTESILLALIGGGVGTLLAHLSIGAIKGMIPGNIPRVDGIGLDGWVLLFAFLVMLGAGVVFGLAPALFSARTDLVGILSGGGASRSGGMKRNRALSVLVVAQIALAIMMVNAAVMLFTSYRNVVNEPQAFDTQEVLVADLRLTGERYESVEYRHSFWNRLMARLRSIPGVTAAGATSKLPTRGGTNGSILAAGESYDPEERRPLVEVSFVTPGYFEAMGIGLLRGRGFETNDMRPERREYIGGVTVVNRQLAETYWPEGEPIGQVIRNNGAEEAWSYEVVGVVEDVRQWGILHPPLRERYMPLPASWGSNFSLVLRSEEDPYDMVPAVRGAVQEVDPYLAVDGFTTMADMVRGQMQSRHLYTLLMGLFMAIAVLLATAGTYGVMSYRVARSTREIGIRMALGAGAGQVMRDVLSEGIGLTLKGAFFGIWALFIGTAIIGHMVYGIQPLQVLYQVGGILLLGLVVLAAIAIPAGRATRVDPMESLRTE